MIEPLDIRYDGEIRKGTAELYHCFDCDVDIHVLYFQSAEDHERWLSGEGFKLINHWTKPAKPPKYK